ncbi:HDOD domain-containing protein [Photobacterium damselae subsp. damselae]|uniref:HDOD domain-containing protein n=1 Tax=Photobacterium damselae TaxID=38293 RepID=UPI000A2FD867|nr:HDOD domain-containing protein [Photobacterium damselae]ARR49667.1 histidine kinase [Photobacterium damselae subsp. damselae]QAY35789.1 HDOD domain-containing protein [Photobacterium damselae subsp. damselae]QOQ69478.1 HDOD domain-containing protein [Photobacterium damselae subsp. damselae]
MSHLSFFWLNPEHNKLIKGIESEFCNLVKTSIRNNQLTLPQIPTVLTRLQQACLRKDITVREVANIVIDDPALTAKIIRTSNAVLFNRRNIVCNDLSTAISRLGIMRVRDIATVQAIETLKFSYKKHEQCNKVLQHSAHRSRQLAGTMALICYSINQHPDSAEPLLPEKALLTGLLADIGLFSLLSEYQLYLKNGNYLDLDAALFIFQECCSDISPIILKHWGFDNDYQEVASNRKLYSNDHINYLDIARMANHLLLMKNNDDAIHDHYIELDLLGAEVMYELSQLELSELNKQIHDIIKRCGI